MLTEFQDPEFVRAVVCVREKLRTSPTAVGLAVGLGAYWFRRRLLCEAPIHALISSAVMGFSAGGAVAAAINSCTTGEPITVAPKKHKA